MRGATLATLAASVSSALATYQGFNYGSTDEAGADIDQSGFESLFTTAKGLVGTSSDFTAARLYTMIQGGTTDTVISAIPAAIATETYLLLGLWASGGDADFEDELTALTNAISQYGSDMESLVVGISVGSEDLYRISTTGVEADAGVGAEPSTIVDYISKVRSAISGTTLKDVPVGHVDTWTAWVNASNDAVIDAIDFAGMDAYPYFQNTETNGIDVSSSLFSSAYEATVAAVGSVPVWVTETGWPVSGSTENLAVASTANAKTYWDEVGCDQLFGKVNTFWYILQDYGASPSFGVVGETLSTTPLYDLSCNASSSSTSSSSSAASTSSATKSVAAATTPSAVAVSATSSVSENPVPSASYAASASTSGTVAASSGSAVSASGSSAVAASGSVAGTTTPAAATATASAGSDDVTYTVTKTTVITLSGDACAATTETSASVVTASASSAASVTTTKAASAVTSSASSTAATASSTASGCPADLSGDYQYPHLIVPVSSAAPDTAYGTQYDGTINSTVSTIFNFDIPASYAGKTCSLVFLFPELSALETSSYTFNGEGGIVSHVLSTVATSSTTYSNQGSQVSENGAITTLTSGNSYVISSDSCPASTTVAFELSSTNGLALEFFEDYNPSPLGLYVRAC